jgi:phage shock protein A
VTPEEARAALVERDRVVGLEATVVNQRERAERFKAQAARLQARVDELEAQLTAAQASPLTGLRSRIARARRGGDPSGR